MTAAAGVGLLLRYAAVVTSTCCRAWGSSPFLRSSWRHEAVDGHRPPPRDLHPLHRGRKRVHDVPCWEKDGRIVADDTNQKQQAGASQQCEETPLRDAGAPEWRKQVVVKNCRGSAPSGAMVVPDGPPRTEISDSQSEAAPPPRDWRNSGTVTACAEELQDGSEGESGPHALICRMHPVTGDSV